MLKWAEFSSEGTLYEAFLPESDKDGDAWVLRAIRSNQVVAERKVRLAWRPSFGPDSGDLEALESELDRLMEELRVVPVPAHQGAYVAGEVEVDPPDPLHHAALYGLLESFPAVAQTLELEPGWVSRLLGLPEGWRVEDLYPVALTRRRRARMERLAALSNLVFRHPELVARMPVLLVAILHDDADALKAELLAVGLVGDEPSPPGGEVQG